MFDGLGALTVKVMLCAVQVRFRLSHSVPGSRHSPCDGRPKFRTYGRAGSDVTLGLLHSSATAAFPPQQRGTDEKKNRSRDIESLKISLEPLPMPAKQISCAGDHGHPQCRSKKIEDHESPPRHSQHSCKGPSDHSQP